ncbi:MAG TPA: beta-aspartyl-peptidase [Candidatus Ozemobacteraceae bacterium]|nr:beta-aspartyl-peptidase [Candidatus Ozemobacteraceae bacterium]
MITVIRNGEVHAPRYLGRKDILVGGGKILGVADSCSFPKDVDFLETIDAEGKLVVPGFIDSHVHICGGGGEGGFKTRTPEIGLTDMTCAGVTTVVGCLGTDGIARSMKSLVAKARALEEEGVTAFIYTGSYQVPVRTICGSIEDDLILIDKVIGVGEIAMSDHRSSQPTVSEIAKIAAAARVGGLLAGKAGIVNIHLGDGKRMLSFLEEIAATTEIPLSQFVPTHIGRNPELFRSGIEYARRGGYVDFTTSTTKEFLDEGEIKCSRALGTILAEGVPPDRITFSSDGQGSLPLFGPDGKLRGLTVGTCASLFPEVRDAVVQEGVDLSTALRVITSNPAEILKLRGKGCIKAGNDADLVLLRKDDLAIDTVMANGRVMVRDGKAVVHGTFIS